MTDSGRTVYGGGGITPDEKYAPPKFNKFQTELLRKYAFFNFSAKFFGAPQTPSCPRAGSRTKRDERFPRFPAEAERWSSPKPISPRITTGSSSS